MHITRILMYLGEHMMNKELMSDIIFMQVVPSKPDVLIPTLFVSSISSTFSLCAIFFLCR